MKIRVVFLISLLIGIPMALAAPDTWHSDNFITLPLPSEWKAKAGPSKEKDDETVIEWGTNQTKLDYILSRLGLPDRYMTGNSQSCLAAALFGPDGKNIKLIK